MFLKVMDQCHEKAHYILFVFFISQISIYMFLILNLQFKFITLTLFNILQNVFSPVSYFILNVSLNYSFCINFLLYSILITIIYCFYLFIYMFLPFVILRVLLRSGFFLFLQIPHLLYFFDLFYYKDVFYIGFTNVFLDHLIFESFTS